ncbi:MAG: efflux RND transporter permease subunit [Candidatus Eiseniibacteriota bacterium]|jgi:multidrug efflux pump subunit AcrB
MIRFATDHPVATWMFFTAAVLCGLYALPRLSLEAMPETELPSLSIQTGWNGASPSAVQRAITVPIEAAARRVHGVEKVTARSSPSMSSVEIEFRRGVDLEFARLELSEQIGAVRSDLPAGAGQPEIVPYVPEEFRTEEFFSFSLISPLDANEIRERAETWLVPRLLAIQGVADAELQGGARPLIKVLLDLERMERYGLTADAIYARLAALDDITPAGEVRDGGRELVVTVQGRVTLDRVRSAALATRGGQPITVEHVARVVEDFEDPSYFVRINGENVIQAIVAKRSGENSVSVSRRLRAALPRLETSLPFQVSFEIDEDQGKVLEEKLFELVYRSLVILGLLFVLLALALRRLRLTAIVVFSILLAIVICLSMFYFFGISVNFITISGLTVCFGMLLDNSILVLDSIHRRLTRNGVREARDALVDGAREVAFPILATTFTTVVAFLSFIFLSGRLSLYYVPLAVSVGIAMLASIVVAFCWIPVALRGTAERELAARRGPDALRVSVGEPSGRRQLLAWMRVVFAVTVVAAAVTAVWKGTDTLVDHWTWGAGILGLLLVVGAFSSFVERITAFHLRFWWYPVTLMLALFAGGWWVFRNEIHEGGFWRQRDPEKLVCFLERPVGTDVVLSTETMRLFESELLPIPDGIHMKTWSFQNRAYMEIEFEPEMLRTEYPQLYRNRLIVLAEELGGMFIWINGFGDPYLKGAGMGGLSNSLIKITGYNSKVLDGICEGVVARLERNRRVRNTRLTSGRRFERASADETVVVIHRDRLRSHGLSIAEVTGHLRRLLGIETPWHMIVDGEDQRLQLSFADAEQIQYDQVMQKTVRAADGEPVRLADLITLETRQMIASINREDQRYSMQINWEYIGTDRMRQHYISEILAGIDLPYGYTAEDVSGERLTEEEEEEAQQMLWLTVLFIFMALAALFESIALPFLVLTALPMALTGVVGLFWLTDTDFDSSARIGLVLLFGIVVNNAILLVNRYRLQVRELVAERGLPRGDAEDAVPERRRLGGVDLWRLPRAVRQSLLREAITTGTRIQLRSILLTSGTTIAGLLPLLVRIGESTSEGKDIWENLALSSIGGLASSTVLIISAIPALYWITTRWGWGLARLGAWLRRRRGGAATALGEPAPQA